MLNLLKTARSDLLCTNADALDPDKFGEPLPFVLESIGWSKCWSSREDRLYFFNTETGQTRWEVPTFPNAERKVVNSINSDDVDDEDDDIIVEVTEDARRSVFRKISEETRRDEIHGLNNPQPRHFEPFGSASQNYPQEYDIDLLRRTAQRMGNFNQMKKRSRKFDDEVAPELVRIKDAKLCNMRYDRFHSPSPE